MRDRIIVIGASLNGIAALTRLVRNLPPDFEAPVLIAQHVSAHAPGVLPQLLSVAGGPPAFHPKDGEPLRAGCVFVAPPDRHMLVERGRIRLSHGPKENFARPAVDPLFRSAAIEYGPLAVGVILTGQLDDGTAGLLAIKDRGGVAIVQDPAEAPAPSMPRSALRHVPVDYRCKLDEISKLLVELVQDAPGTGQPVEPLIAIEARIAEGISTVEDWLTLERLSKPSGLTCPDCRTALYELPDRRLLRFRCRAGHGFSGESLISGQEDARESLLCALFGAFIDEAALARRLAAMPEHAADPASSAYLGARAERLQEQADQVRSWLRALTGLIDPEPALGPQV